MKSFVVVCAALACLYSPCLGSQLLNAPRDVNSSSCSSGLSSTYESPTVSSGWEARLVVDDLVKPRSIVFDTSGNLLVLESGRGITRVTFADNGGTCLAVQSSLDIVADASLNHGLTLSADGNTLYASNASSVLAWPYDARTGTITHSTATVLIAGMASANQVTRTLLVSRLAPDVLLVSRGSDADYDAIAQSSGLGQLKAFNLSALAKPTTTTTTTTTASEETVAAADFDTSAAGRLLGWGLYNAVGVAVHPSTGGVFAMDNGADGVTRDGVDIHQSNPGDEMNFHGFLNGSTAAAGLLPGASYGYPQCSAAWNTSIPGLSSSSSSEASIEVGEQFSVDNSTVDDAACQTEFVAPRLTFEPHQAPLDMIFSADGTTAYISFHGSTDKTQLVGYLVGEVSFDPTTGQPTSKSTSQTALSPIIRNTNATACPAACMRPVGLALDGAGRLFFSSDATGEIYVVVRSAAAAGSGLSAHGKKTVIAVTVAVGLAAVLAVVGLALWRRKKKYGRVLPARAGGRRRRRGSMAVPEARNAASAVGKNEAIQMTDRESWGSTAGESKTNVFREEMQRQDEQRGYQI